MKECSKELSEPVIGCAIEVHHALGAVLLENTYEKCLAYELSMKDIPFNCSSANSDTVQEY